MISKFICLFVLIGVVLANEQYITIYEDRAQAGASLTIREKLANLTEIKPFLNNASSYCAVGWWVGYTNPDFNIEGGVGILLDQTDANPRCENRVFMNFNSLRYLANIDSNVPSIGLYSKSSYHGYELVLDEEVTAPQANLTFTPLSFVTTGSSNWTFYESENFEGISWCFTSAKKVTLVADLDPEWPSIGSIEPGCNV